MLNKLTPCLAVAALVAPACAAENWSTDLPASLAKASQENKYVLVDFNGSDWCGPCIALKEKVLSTPEFEAYAKDKFVLVDIDLPRGDKLSAEKIASNRELVKQYEVEGFPTILVMNGAGVVMGGFVGGNDSVPAVTSMLDEALAAGKIVDVEMAKAATLEGVDKAKALFAAYNAVPSEMRAKNQELKKQVLALDPSDTLGINAEGARKSKIMSEMNSVFLRVKDAGKDIKSMMAAIDSVVTDKFEPESKAELLGLKAQVTLQYAESVEDIAQAKDHFDRYCAALGEKGVMMEKQMSQIFADPKALLERIKQSRQPQK